MNNRPPKAAMVQTPARALKLARAVIAAAALLSWVGVSSALADDPPSLVNFQGRLTDTSNNPLAGAHSFVFRIYNDPAAGALLWNETQPAVVVTNGVLSAMLGSVTSLESSVFSGATTYLEITVDGVTLSPRERLITTPYAFNAAAVGGKHYTSFVSTENIAQAIYGDKTFAGTLSVPSPSLAAHAASKAYVDAQVVGASGWSRSAAGIVYVSVASDNIVVPSTLTVQGAAFSVGGSTLAVRYGNVGVGTTAPTATLDVNGGALFGSGAKSGFSSAGALSLAAGQGISVAGGAELTGLPASPSGNASAASKAYVDAQLAGNAAWTRDASGVVRLTTATDNVVVQATMTVQGAGFSVGDSTLAVRMGNVGVGTSAPSATLHVVGDGRIQPAAGSASLNLRSATAGNDFLLSNEAVTNFAYVWNRNNTDMIFGTNNIEKMRILADGNVGIGVASPQSKLHVSSGVLTIDGLSPAPGISVGISTFVVTGGKVGIGTSAPGARLELAADGAFNSPPGLTKSSVHINPLSGANGNAAGITFGANNAGSVSNAAQAGIYAQSSSAYGTRLWFATTNNFGAGANANILIDEAGRLGVGNLPSAVLDVGGSPNAGLARAVVRVHDQTTMAAGTGGGVGLGGFYDVAGTTIIGAAVKAAKANATDGNTEFDLAFLARRNGAADVSEYMRILGSSGFVGISTSAPAATLDVNGTAQFGQTGKSTFSAAGVLTLPVGYAPTGAQDAATKLYVDGQLANAGGWSRDGSGVVKLSTATDNVTIQTTATVQGAAFSVGGSTFAVFAGNIGISTSAPPHRLTVTTNRLIDGIALDGSAAPAVILKTNNAIRGYIGLPTTNGQFVGGSAANADIVFRTENGRMLFAPFAGPALLDLDAGLVGIGTTAPNYLLDVQGGQVNSSSGFCMNGDCRAGWSEIGGGWRRDASGVVTLSTNTDAVMVQSTMSVEGAAFSVGRSTLVVTNGRVGIGVTAPYVYSRLHAKDPSSSFWAIIAEATANQGVIGMSHDGAKGLISVSYLDGSGFKPLAFQTSNAVKMIIDPVGNVGVGLTNPARLLDVNGGSTFRSSSTWIGSAQPALTAAGEGGFYYDASRKSFMMSQDGSAWEGLGTAAIGGGWTRHASGVVYLTTSTDNVLVASTLTVQGAAFSVGGSTFMVANGQVGVGTIISNAKFSIRGDVNSYPFYASVPGDFPTTSTLALFQVNNGAASAGQLLANQVNSVNTFGISAAAGAQLALSGNNQFVTPHVLISTAGSMGIGTTNPLAQFHVSGAGGSEFRLDTSNPNYISLKAGAKEVARMKP